MKHILFILIIMADTCLVATTWTYHYKKLFSPKERIINKNKSELKFVKCDVPHFNQLILSWNAVRPAKGHFTFWSQVRDAKTKKWHRWHKMSQWGNGIQRSFFVEDTTTNHHVRVEIPVNALADSLCIKVQPEDGAQLADLHGLYVCISDFTKFSAELVDSLLDLAATEVANIPQFSQMELDHPKKEVLCSPTSCSMVTSYFMKTLIDPVTFANRCYDDGLEAYGSWPYNTAHAYECCNEKISFAVARLNSFRDLHHYLCKKIPVIVSVRGQLKGAPQEYKQGHLLVVIGWNPISKKVICHDPAFASQKETYVHYDAASFLQAWERSRRLAYLAKPII